MATDLGPTNLLRRHTGDSDLRTPCIESQTIPGVDDIAAESPITVEQPQYSSNGEGSAIPYQTCSIVDEETIDTITTTAETVAPVIADLPDPMRTRIEGWCDLHGFNTEGGLPETTLARQAVYYILLKITLYEWHHRYGHLPELPENMRDGLRTAGTQTGNPAFEECVLDDLIWLAGETAVEGVVEIRDRLLESTQPAEDIGALYEAILSNEVRRPLGQFRTPPAIGKTMRTWAANEDDTVLDPGVGAGGLSTPAHHPQWSVNTDPTYVSGIDRSPLSLLMGSTALTLARQSHDPHRADFLSISPEDLSEDVDSIVCNPPYTRHQALPADYKESINLQAEQETGLEISTATPLYAYFIYHTRDFLTEGNWAAFLIPPNFLAADYGDALKQFLLAEFDIKALLLFDLADGPVFDDALTTVLIAFLEVSDETAESETRFIRVEDQWEKIPIQEIVRDGKQGRRDWGFVNCVPQESLTPAENWRSLFEPLDFDTSLLTPFSEIAEIHRGIMTGENDFFRLSQADIDEVRIKERYLSQLAPSPRVVHGLDFRQEDWERHRDNGEAVWLLYHLDAIDGVPRTIEAVENGCSEGILTPEAASSPSLVAYLQSGLVEHPTLASRYTIRTRSPWYRVDRRDPPPILIPYMYRSGFRALLNETDARYVNNYLGVYPDGSLSRTQVKALLAYLNSSLADKVVRRDARLYGGMDKLEPGDLADVPVLDPQSVTEETVTALANQFDELRETARRNGSCTAVVSRIDAILEQEL
ncbi:Eco57I restriction-modification methylase domain-containing protein [Halopenitus sp. H-Gu1]|uniref:Eco57I restriction-modification methylase domain-containing protein n=1 Tax=Halopenitus sp. H-Gu1 TaxID=3242697 RepID=UPI00359D7459